MRLEEARVGFAMCGSYCTHAQTMAALERLAPQCGSVIPILSENSGHQDTRFGSNQALRAQLEALCGHPVLDTIVQVEPIGPKHLLDLLIIAPCTGNTLGKLAAGITDTAITMAAKAHLRNGGPVLLGPSTNDGLSVSLRNLGDLLCRKGYYCVPFRQDDPAKKPNSLVSRMELIPDAARKALKGEQLQPVLLPSRG
ncbi:MAG: dipicolinate synthase subunit B [Clostridiales bacterium]|nr:dipicolinate synthase subunit B [Clostridiales bacterium]